MTLIHCSRSGIKPALQVTPPSTLSPKFLPLAVKDHAITACDGDQIVGFAVGRVAHEQGWVVLLMVSDTHQGQGIGGRLLGELEIDMAKSGITKLSMLVADDGKSGVLGKGGVCGLEAPQILSNVKCP